MERIQFIIDFVFDENQKLFMKVIANWQGQPVQLTLSSFLTFLYKNEKDINKTDSDFCYNLVKWLKKVTFGLETVEAICDDWDMAYFFKKAMDMEVTLFWNNGTTFEPLQINTTLPITVGVKQVKTKLICSIDNRDEWLDNPLNWLTFKAGKDLFCFSNGVLLQNPSATLQDFLSEFLDRAEIHYSVDEAKYFIEKIYQPNKNDIFWQIGADFSDFMPLEIEPIPYLKLAYQDNILSPTLSYKYKDLIITADYQEDTIPDPQTGKSYKRMHELETIYQNDLIQIFTERNLPFMLQNPGDIATFLSKVVPLLKERDWEIESDLPEFKIQEKPVDLNFTVQSVQDNAHRDWFYFEPNAEVNGQKFSCQEIARLMIQTQGYVKTHTGYVKLSEKSQEDLKLLAKFNAFNPNQKFNQAQVLPLISSTMVSGANVKTKEYITQVKLADPQNLCQPSAEFLGTLRDYQQHGVNWMNFLYKSGLGGILADDMGLGKTVQALAFCSQLTTKKPILIIGPTNVIYNWSHEIQKFLPSRTSLVYSGANRFKNLTEINNFDFVITSFGLIKNDLDWLKGIDFEVIFIDEGQFIKNPQAQVSKAVKELKAHFKLVMTGTPVENHLSDIWNLFDFILPNFLGNHRTFDMDIKEKADIIKTKIKPFILRRVKKEVLTSLPEKTEIMLHCTMNEAQQQIYQTVLTAARTGIKNLSGQRERLHILTSLLKLRQVCVHPLLLKELAGHNLESAKFELVQEKIEELIEEEHKITIFTQFTGVLDLLQKWLEDKNIYYERIDGSVTGKQRMEAVDRFQTQVKPGVFIISLKAGGVGINLTAADYVIHLDPWWNPAIEAQATDRVHRMGQQNKVIVYKMITEGTIEEKIQELQEEKKQLLAQLIDEDSVAAKHVDLNELKNLLM